jgi:hypothetical protein
LPAEYTIETPTITLPPFEKTCSTFVGLFDDANFTGSAVTQILQGSTGNKVFYVNFAADSFNITASAGANGTISPSGVQRVLCSSSLNFSFLPSDGYEVDVLQVNGANVPAPSTSYNFENITANNTINVTFKQLPPGQKTLTLQVEPANGGTTLGGGTFDSANIVYISAIANSGWRFTEWQRANGTTLTTDHSTSVTLLENMVLTAHF